MLTGDSIPTYVTLINLTDQAVKTPKEMPARVENARKTVEKMGGKWVNWFLTMGAYDAVVITEWPDDATEMRFALSIAALGNVRTTTLKAFSEAEMKKVVEKLP